MTSRTIGLTLGAAVAAIACAGAATGATQCVTATGAGRFVGPPAPTAVAEIVYVHGYNARTAFNIPVQGGLLGFWGGRDAQPDLEHYTLYLDSITLVQNGKLMPDTPATGVCTLLVNANASRFLDLECKAVAGGKTLTLSFKDDGKPHKSVTPCG
jgi:hypothetical protein